MTYRTKNRIGEIPESTEIRVAKYTGVFSATRDALGLTGDDIDHIYTDEASLFRKYPDKTWTIVYLGDYVITDGERIEVTSDGTLWTEDTGTPPEPVAVVRHGRNYVLRGRGTGTELIVTPIELASLVARVQELAAVP